MAALTVAMPTVTNADLALRVVRRTDGADGIVVLELRPQETADLPSWGPGAHIDLETSPGTYRSYSLCGDPADSTTWRVAILREPAGRGGSVSVHENLHTGSPVHVRGPRNHFALQSAPSYVFIAGGIGITPILPMIHAAIRAGAQWELHYGGRSRGAMVFLDECESLGELAQIHPEDEVGLLDIAGILAARPPDTLVYCCGPTGLLDAVEDAMAEWPEGSLHVERFAPRSPTPPCAGVDESFEIVLAASGQTLTVPPEKSVLEALEEAGVAVMSSCREGTCGTCETTVLDGHVEHRDSLLTPHEQAANDVMLVCVSRSACPRLVLDI